MPALVLAVVTPFAHRENTELTGVDDKTVLDAAVATIAEAKLSIEILFEVIAGTSATRNLVGLVGAVNASAQETNNYLQKLNALSKTNADSAES